MPRGALELARAGVGRLRLLDHDHVEPATAVRWPFGFAAAGLPKVLVLKQFIEANYPWTRVDAIPHRLGAVDLAAGKDAPSEWQILAATTDGAALILDATAELGVQQFLTDYARERALTYVGVSGTNGAWGGKVFRFVPGAAGGCWMCYRRALAEGTIPLPPDRPDDAVQAQGCGDPTFTGSNFDMMLPAMTAVRFAVSALCSGAGGGYPELPWDVMVVSMRDGTGLPVEPAFKGFQLAKDPNCPTCSSPE